MIIEVTDLNLNRLGQIKDTWGNKQVEELNGPGEFEFTMAIDQLDIEALEYKPKDIFSFLNHQTLVRLYEDGRYWFTGQPFQIELSEDSSGQLIAHIKCIGAMRFLSRFNAGKRVYRNARASDILRDLLGIQSLIIPGTIDFIDEISITFSRESLYDAIHALRDILGGDIYLDPHDMTFNWVRRQGGKGPEIRYQRNMTFIRVVSDTSDHFTRIIPLGAGQGENEVTIASVNNGLEYLEADTVGEYGVIEVVWKDEKYRDPMTLKLAAQRRLEEHKHPKIAIETSMIDLSQWRDEWGERPFRDHPPQLGDEVRIYHDRLGIDIRERIHKIQKNWDEDKRHEIGIELADRRRTYADMIAEINNRIENLKHDKGYTFTSSYIVSEEIGGLTTARMRFFIPSDVIRINYARLLRTGTEVGGGGSELPPDAPLSATITIAVNGTQVSSSNQAQIELELKNFLQIGRWNTIIFSADNPVRLDAALDIKQYFQEG